MSHDNPILDEIQRTREAILAEHHGDMGSLVHELQEITEAMRRQGRPVYSPANRPVPSASELDAASAAKKKTHLSKSKARRKPSQPA
jgi:hypothetical protein